MCWIIAPLYYWQTNERMPVGKGWWYYFCLKLLKGILFALRHHPLTTQMCKMPVHFISSQNGQGQPSKFTGFLVYTVHDTCNFLVMNSKSSCILAAANWRSTSALLPPNPFEPEEKSIVQFLEHVKLLCLQKELFTNNPFHPSRRWVICRKYTLFYLLISWIYLGSILKFIFLNKKE